MSDLFSFLYKTRVIGVFGVANTDVFFYYHNDLINQSIDHECTFGIVFRKVSESFHSEISITE